MPLARGCCGCLNWSCGQHDTVCRVSDEALQQYRVSHEGNNGSSRLGITPKLYVAPTSFLVSHPSSSVREHHSTRTRVFTRNATPTIVVGRHPITLHAPPFTLDASLTTVIPFPESHAPLGAARDGDDAAQSNLSDAVLISRDCLERAKCQSRRQCRWI